ncbi:von Willebrand factor type A domain-containing protein [Lentinula edodes]|uniref:von Willebrand factor type A domain-containing protein n=1 Tax=Lentinula edodes TaxID=5353 RepID=UPI001E8E2C49|nr:von Willebrand factor type A domain-containing protein [Lentinula edodes]KAH7869311.1 von Willebrand factor type A domain-containing protein [Lentinula edodes]
MARTKIRSPTLGDCRLYDAATGQDLILDGSSAQVLIADIHASVNLSQRFTNTSYTTISSAVYTFGLMAGAAVCGFEMIKQDGTRVEGVVKENEAAKKEYEQAIQAGKTASLGQQETEDVFSITVGNVLPSETVEINLHYIQPLTDDEKKDQVKFIFPRTYAQRYGQAPTDNSARGTTVHQPFNMKVIVQQSGVIKSISCPSAHPIQLELGLPDGLVSPEKDESEDKSPSFALVTLTDTSGFLTQDVVLVINAGGLDSPRCFIEQHPSPNHETTAMALTFVPRFTLPDIKSGVEYVFVVDRSGSMKGERIRLVQEALVILLRGLPTSGTTFNIVSFGAKATKLWDVSRQYSQTSLEEATNHVDSMQADYGGTEIASALSLVYSSLPKPLARPVAVILLTDGSAWDVPTCVSHTQNAISTLPISKPDSNDPVSFIRVFTVGIGDGASSDTCDSIARAGNGFAVYVKQGEPVAGKCARVVRAARTPMVVDVMVDWTGDQGADHGEQDGIEGVSNDDFEIVDNPGKGIQATTESLVPVSAVSLFNNDDDGDDKVMSEATGPPPAPDPQLPPPPKIQQSPLILRNIFPGTRTQVYAIVRTPQNESGTKGEELPVTVKIKGVVSTTRAPVELVVPVSRILRSPFKPRTQPQSGDDTGLNSGLGNVNSQPFLHVIAAKALIIDRQDGKHAFPDSIAGQFQNDQELKEAYLNKEIVRLGTTYSLASKLTSFVAVDHRSHEGSSGNPTAESVFSSTSNVIPISGFLASQRRMAVQSQRAGSGKAARKQLAPRAARKAAASISSSSFAVELLEPRPLYSGKPPPPPAWGPPQSWNAESSVDVSEFQRISDSDGNDRPVKRMNLNGASSPSSFSDPTATASGPSSSSTYTPSMQTRQQARGRVVERERERTGQLRTAGFARTAPATTPLTTPTTAFVASLSPVSTSPASKSSTDITTSDRLTAIARLQKFNGQLSLTSPLLVLLEINESVQEVERKLAAVDVSGNVGATVLTWAWMEKMRIGGVGVGEEILGLIEKAREWVESELAGLLTFEDVKQKVLSKF